MLSRFSHVVKILSHRGLAVLSHLNKVGMDQDIRWTRKFAARLARVLVLAGMSFPINQIPVRASALTYTTILSFVPFAVILSSVAGHFGYLDMLSKLVYYLADTMNLDINLDPILSVIEYAQKVDFHRLGIVGSFGLLFTFFLSMSNIELAMDHIWDIRKKRNWWRRIKEYTPFLLLLILIITVAGNFLLKYRVMLDSKFEGLPVPNLIHRTLFLLSTASIAGFVWLALILLFFIIPNTRVRMFPAVLASTIATGAICLLARIMILFPSLFLSRNNFIYGSMAALPVVLLLIYLFWVIVLYGAAVAFIYQRLYHPRDRSAAQRQQVTDDFHRMEKDVLAVLKAVHALSGSKELSGRKIVPLKNLAAELWDDENSVQALAAPLVELGLLARRRIRSGPVYAPRKSLRQTDLTAIHNLLLRLDPQGNGKLRSLTSWDELNHTLGILYSSGKLNPPLYLSTVLSKAEGPQE